MKNLTLSTLLILITAGIWAQDKTYNLNNFSHLDASSSVEIELIQSTSNKAEVEILRGDPDDFRLKESGNNLNIYWKDQSGYNWNNNRKAKVTLYYTSLEEIEVSAGAKVHGDDVIKGDKFTADADSGGSLEIVIEVEELISEVNSGGRLEIEGTTNTLDVDANSGGAFRGKNLKATHVKAHANSGGSAKVWATNSIKASANSGGNVSYKGDPTKTDIKTDKWSGGSVSKN